MPVFSILFIALICVPILEVYLLISVGRMIGAPETILVIIGTAILGAGLLRWQGLVTLARFQQALNQGVVPAVELVEGLILLVTAALLLTPGFFTDTIGFICLIPPVRQYLGKSLMDYFLRHSTVHGAEHGRVIPGEYSREDGDTDDHHERLRRPHD